MQPVVKMVGIVKRFPGVTANDGVDFDLLPGEVHALLGENGAGKTTLMNVLYGLYRCDGGEIFVHGERVDIRSPKDSIELGVAMVHQQFELVGTLTVAENVALGNKSPKAPLLDLDAVATRLEELSSKYGLEVNPNSIVNLLTVGERQRVEILKALYRGAKILILDEPTSVLTPQESEGLFGLLRSMAAEESSVVIITHKLPEVLEVSDRVTVLRKGRVVGTVNTSATSSVDLAVMMVGAQPAASSVEPGKTTSEIVLEMKDVYAMNRKGALGLKGLSISLREGEILGIAGVAGNGQNELVEVLSGLRRTDRGSVVVNGTDVTNGSPSTMIRSGIGVIPEDRKGAGLIPEFSIAENLILETRRKSNYSKHGILDHASIHSNGERVVREFSIATPNVEFPAYTLSGGNLQKLVLAKVLSRNPRILVAAQPSAGLDIGATEFIWNRLRSERSKGVGILLISSDLSEILALSDRVACIYEGTISGVLQSSEADSAKLGLLMGGEGAK